MAERITPHYYASNVVVPSPESDLSPKPLKKLWEQHAIGYGGRRVPDQNRPMSKKINQYTDIWKDIAKLDQDSRLDSRAVAGILNEATDPYGTILFRVRVAEERRKLSPPKEIEQVKVKPRKRLVLWFHKKFTRNNLSQAA